ncbi:MULTISPECIES: HAD-IA family hydrolase [Limnobacter]|uniref:Hydrolase n=1 Tax=Limnobacter litoralis TaxID=481366 RepID=A0ABQ5YR97_9BURK|nr:MULTISPECIES: HAD-IA family hydrolase [Limnobacter]GLR25890.1 hydrolase [Limnobacter litoralis]HEX5484757.1 HAD-IA family hydrolase [Limnobacter sp.]
MKYKMVVFDWDGTILDSTGAITRAIQRSCVDVGLPDPGPEIASYVIGLGLSDALRHAAPGATDAQIKGLVEGYRRHYLATDHELQIFDGVVPLLQALNERGVLCTVATGKSRQGLNRAMAQSGTGRYFSASRCADECFSKPHPQMLHELMAEFALEPEDLVMIGDTTHDLQMAQSAGVHSVAVQSGAHTPALLATVPHLIAFPSINEAAPWLINNVRKFEQ